MDDQAVMINSATERCDVVQQSSTAEVTVEIRTFVFTKPESGVSTTVVVNTGQNFPRVPSINQQIRSRSKAPPLPSAIRPTFSAYRSRSQTITQRQASGSIPSSFGKSTGASRRMRVSSMGLTDGMKSLTLEECEDMMDFTWE